MGLFNRGQAASALILDGKRAVRAYLGDQLVWDGTMDAFVADSSNSGVGRDGRPGCVGYCSHRSTAHHCLGSGLRTVRLRKRQLSDPKQQYS